MTFDGDRSRDRERPESPWSPEVPSASHPPGGGALRGIDERVTVQAATGSGTFALRLPATPARGLSPALSLVYDSAAGAGPFGLGWRPPLEGITRRTDRGVPAYDGGDVFGVIGGDDLVPRLATVGGEEVPQERPATLDGEAYTVATYRSRIEGSFARVERWTSAATSDTHWRTISADNVVSVFGRDAQARVADPERPLHVFTWLLEEVRDDRGHVARYEYKAEDSAGVGAATLAEQGRGETAGWAQRYLKRVRYGNAVPHVGADWLFELVLDYGEHDPDAPTPHEERPWSVRPDPFSTYRQGFEVRTYRLCRRALMFHHFAELGDEPCLVRALELTYDEDAAVTRLARATEHGYERDGAGYRRRSLPPTDFRYSEARMQPAATLGPRAAGNLPAGLETQGAVWTDLDGDGLAGVLLEQADGWYYKRNLGDGDFGAARPVGPRPASTAVTSTGEQTADWQLADVDGDGLLELVTRREPAGYFERTEDSGYGRFVAFDQHPRIDWADPAVRVVDLTGDGLPDVLVLGDDVHAWHPSLGRRGHGPARRRAAPRDERDGPAVVFADGTESLLLADMSGDGLADLVRVRNRDVCYWPNLGHGRFGRRVAMDRAPRFDREELFDPARIRLADVDGSGPADLLYVDADGVISLYRNEAGNGWGGPTRVHALPGTDWTRDLTVVDLLGRGTACLVWSSPLPADAGRQLRYVDLAGGTKPHLLVGVANNVGLETTLTYAPSTRFSLADRAAGTPWRTRLPFPVHVVERAETTEAVTGTRTVSRYTYHHGHYDSAEREFRGFGRVDRYDTETYEHFVRSGAANALEAPLHAPPVLVRTWYHTCAPPAAPGAPDRLRHEYHTDGGPGGDWAPPPVVDAGLDSGEWREAFRALTGALVRQETYRLDDDAPEHPVAVRHSAYEVVRRQPGRGPALVRGVQTPRTNAVFSVIGRQTLSRALEDGLAVGGSDPLADARVTHTVVLATDELGNPTRVATVAYGRRVADPTLPPEVRAAQAVTHVGYAELAYTGDVSGPDTHRLRSVWRRRTFDVTGLQPAGDVFTAAELDAAITVAAPLEFEQEPDGSPQRRLVGETRVRFLADDLAGPLAFGELSSLALPADTFELAFTPGLRLQVYGADVDDATLTGLGYSELDADGRWWTRSGTAVYAADAPQHFLLPSAARDPFGNITSVERDPYDLAVVRHVDPVGNETRAELDYRVMQAWLVTDPNGNRVAVRFDELGLPVASAALGKEGAGEGDTLDDPTVALAYELDRFRASGEPCRVRTSRRERHGPGSPLQETVAYLGGDGRVVMAKTQAPPGPALTVLDDGTVTEVDTSPGVRWVGNGRTVVNNKGQPVKQYEPYFSATDAYEDDPAMVELGVAVLHRYDALGRPVATEHPDGSTTHVELGAWQRRSHDANDTVLSSTWYAARGAPDPAGAEPAEAGARAAWLAAQHAGTPAVSHLDALGRVCAAVADNGPRGTRLNRMVGDAAGSRSETFDARGRRVVLTRTNLAGVPVLSNTMEHGTRRAVPDVLGRPALIEDSTGTRLRPDHDAAGRVRSVFLREQTGAERVVVHLRYGESHPQARERNLRGRPYQFFDQAGVLALERFDLDGNPLASARRFAADVTSAPDWAAVAAAGDDAAAAAAADPLLEAESFATGATFDALGRAGELRLHGGTVLVPGFGADNRLDRLDVSVLGAPATRFLDGQGFNARGQRTSATLGNGITVRSEYDPATFRLARQRAERQGDGALLQDLAYTYDPVGNLTEAADGAQQTLFFANAVVSPLRRFAHDALYQLVHATGREQAGGAADAQRAHGPLQGQPLPHPNDAAAVRAYAEEYTYDETGNLTSLRHVAQNATWRRRYRYDDDTNRLQATSLPGDDDDGPYSARYTYDAQGNMASMPHLAAMTWDALGRLVEVDLGGGGTAFYAYAADGHRVRKVVVRGGLVEDTRYLGALEIHRRTSAGDLRLERHTVHVGGEGGRIAIVEVKTTDTDEPASVGQVFARYQLTDQVGSVAIETDETGALLTYEEYHPYGTSAYRSGRTAAEASLKRYRYIGGEEDPETRLYHLGARYYAPWLGRWTSPDPAGFVDGFNLYAYARNSPAVLSDPGGTNSDPRELSLRPPEDVAPYVTQETEEARGRVQSWLESVRVTVDDQSYRLTNVELEFTGGRWTFTSTRVAVDEGQAEGEAPTDGGGVVDTEPGGEAPAAPATPPAEAPGEEPPGAGGGGEAEPAAEPAEPAEPALAPVPHAGRQVLEEAVRPRSATGTRAQGTLHLWSGPEGKASAQRAMRTSGTGWMMGDIGGTPTPQHLAGEAEFARARAGAPGGQLTQAEFERIWGPRSAEVVGRGAFAGHPVEAHGTPRPESIQRRYEWPARSVGGGIRGPFIFGTGMFTALTGAHDPNQAVAITSVLLGVGEATSGIIYGAGAIGASAEAMAIGTAGATAFGGAAAAVGFGVASARSFERGDTTGGIVNALGAIGGVLLVASLFTPVGWVGLAGVGLVALAAGFNLGRWLRN